MEKSRPYITLSAAISIDGKIATRTGDSKLSSKKDKTRVHKLRAKTDAILIGSNTVRRDDPMLTVRYAKGKNPIRIVLDSQAGINPKSKIIKTSSKIPTIIAVSKKATRKNIARLEKHPIEIMVAGNKNIDVKKLLTLLFRKKIKQILLEGGGTINWEFVRQGLVDEIIITIEPLLIGGKEATTLVEGEGFAMISKSKKLKLRNISKLGNELVLHYKVR
jgi:2,5-diamino-6-(ribosylamino)-4(3H)-pyrimidinone 5'-phosphate reductase